MYVGVSAMAAEWKDIWTVTSQVVAQQPPPIQIFFWMGVVFIVLMVVEGLRASFLPRRFRGDLRPAEANAMQAASPPGTADMRAFRVRAQYSNATKSRIFIDRTPRRSQALRPVIRRIPSSFTTPAESHESQSMFDTSMRPNRLFQADDQLPAHAPSDLAPATEI